MSAIMSFFKPRRPAQFNYRPIYYDERKERLDEIVEAARNNSNLIKGSFKRGTFKQMQKEKRRSARISNIRVLAIIAALLLTAYYLLIR